MTMHMDPISPVIFWVTLIFFFGMLGRYAAFHLKQPAVLGELVMGMVVGNLCYFFGLPLAVVLREGSDIFQILHDVLQGEPLSQAVHASITSPYYAEQLLTVLSGKLGIESIKVAYVVDILSRYGVIYLLFMVGLESSVSELRRTGRESLQVALLGVVMPIILGLGVSLLLMPAASFSVHLFVAATLSATSVGITARVLKEMKKINTREAKTILGAAMIDDVLGLIILAIVSSLVISGLISVWMVVHIIVLALLFFCGALWVGPWILKKAVLFFSFLEPWETKLCIAFLFLMSLSWLAASVQLAAIIGAFAAGLIIHEGFFASEDRRSLGIKELMAPLEALLSPLFFMLMGIQVKLELFFNGTVLITAIGLIIAAVVGKLLSGFGASSKRDRLLVGIGMLPRGEVGLVFASIGRSLGVISPSLFSAIVLMVVVTTFITPLWLKRRYAQKDGGSYATK